MAKYLRLFSDIHLDFDLQRELYRFHEQVWSPTALPTDSETILVLAGDLWYENKVFSRLASTGESWIETVAKRFEHVVLVLGNHDYWGLSLQSAVRKAREHVEPIGNVTLLEQSVVSFIGSNVKLLGGTLWTDYQRDPIAMERVRREIKDYKYITFGEGRVRRRVRPMDMFEVHRQTAKHIFTNCHPDASGQKVIVVTHMAPSIDSCAPDEDRRLDAAYYSDLTKSILSNGKDIKLWVHGHMHKPVDYMIGGTRVLSNPRGYAVERTGYDTSMLLEIENL